MNQKSTVEEIRARFDNDVDRFSVLETGQSATMDAPLVLDLITAAAVAATPGARTILDVGCGAGNYTIAMARRLPGLDVTLLDLSRPMLERARLRLQAEAVRRVELVQGDVRTADLGDQRFDLILAGAVLHHLRSEEEWEGVAEGFFRRLAPGGSLWVADLVSHETPAVQRLLWDRYGGYLAGLRDEAYRDQVFAYIEREDTPRPLTFQIDLLRRVGFRHVDVLHKNACFAAYGAIR